MCFCTSNLSPLNYVHLCVQDKSPVRRMSNTTVAQAVRWVRSQVRGVPAPTLIWTLIACSTIICLLQGLQNRSRHKTVSSQSDHVPDGASDLCGKSDEQQAAEEEEGEDDEDEGEEEGEDDEDEVDEGEAEEKETVGDDEQDEEQEEEEIKRWEKTQVIDVVDWSDHWPS